MFLLARAVDDAARADIYLAQLMSQPFGILELLAPADTFAALDASRGSA